MQNAGQINVRSGCPPESWMHFMSHALNSPGYHLAIMWLGLLVYSVVWFGYNLVSCTLSGLSHESQSGTGIRPMTLTPTVLQVQLEVNGFSRNVATRKPGPKTHWEKNGPRKGCCHGAVVGIAWAVLSNNVFFRTSVSYWGESYKFECIMGL